MRTLSFFAALLTTLSVSAQNTFGDITGTILDATDNNNPLIAATVYTVSGGSVYRAETDEDGRFRISAIPAGQYQLSYIYQSDTVAIERTADVSPDGMDDVGLSYYTGSTLTTFVVKGDRDQLHLKKGVNPEIVLKGKEARLSPLKFNTKDLVTSMTSTVKLNNDGELIFRGARAGDVICYLDGVKMNDVPRVPSAAIGYMMVYSGAIPAKYGDTNGGVVVIETLSYTDLWRDWQNSLVTK